MIDSCVYRGFVCAHFIEHARLSACLLHHASRSFRCGRSHVHTYYLAATAEHGHNNVQGSFHTSIAHVQLVL